MSIEASMSFAVTAASNRRRNHAAHVESDLLTASVIDAGRSLPIAVILQPEQMDAEICM
jgi:hypothetical protein